MVWTGGGTAGGWFNRLRFLLGVTRKDKINNEYIRESAQQE